jgi:NTP pyrophosphatase (non-canonical NTP hydrolase)
VEAKARRINLITEELIELIEAFYQDNYIEQIDALCDLLYVVFGSAVEMGVDLEPFFNDVHRSNMTKIGGHKRESDGKWIKPDDYAPAELAVAFTNKYGSSKCPYCLTSIADGNMCEACLKWFRWIKYDVLGE